MSVRGLPKGGFTSVGGPSVIIPDYGTVEHLSNGGTTGTSVTVPSMDGDEFSIVAAGVSGNSYMYKIGYNETDLEIQELNIGHNGNGWESIHQAYIAPMYGSELTHGTGVNMAYGSSDNPGWARATFRKGNGFRGINVASQRYNINSQVSDASFAPFTNPMVNPGGLCVVSAFKDFTAYPDGISGTGWSLAGNGGLCIQGYYILSTTSIETPPTVTFTSSGGGARYWAGMVTYLR